MEGQQTDGTGMGLVARHEQVGHGKLTAVEGMEQLDELPDEVAVVSLLNQSVEQGQEAEFLGKVSFFGSSLEILHLGLVPAFVAGIEFQKGPSHRTPVAVDIDAVEADTPYLIRTDIEADFAEIFSRQFAGIAT